MSADHHEEIASRLRAVLDQGISDETMKSIKKKVDEIIYQIQDDVDYRLKDELAPNLVSFVEEMAKRTVEQILAGNEDQMRRYLGCERNCWTGRSTSPTYGAKRDEDWHPVIHGQLFEQGAVALRRQIVDAHRDLITSERIIDLEDQVKCLVAKVNKANLEKEKMFDRLREAQRFQ